MLDLGFLQILLFCLKTERRFTSLVPKITLGSRGLLGHFSDSKVIGKHELAAMTVQGWSTPLVPRVAKTFNQHVDSWEY